MRNFVLVAPIKPHFVVHADMPFSYLLTENLDNIAFRCDDHMESIRLGICAGYEWEISAPKIALDMIDAPALAVPALIHDALYQMHGGTRYHPLISLFSTESVMCMTRHECDNIFCNLARIFSSNIFTPMVAYCAVRTFGGSKWRSKDK